MNYYDNCGSWLDYQWIVRYRPGDIELPPMVVRNSSSTSPIRRPSNPNVLGGPLDGAEFPEAPNGTRYRYDAKLKRWVHD